MAPRECRGITGCKKLLGESGSISGSVGDVRGGLGLAGSVGTQVAAGVSVASGGS